MIRSVLVPSLTILFCFNQFTNDSWPWDCFQSTYSQVFSREDYKAGILRVAAVTGNLNMLKYLIEEKNLVVNVNDKKLLLASATGGNVDLIKYLIYEKNLTKDGTESSSPGDNALHKAAQSGNLEAVRFFVETLNYRVDAMNWNGITPSTYAIQAGSLPVLRYLVDEKSANYRNPPPMGENLIFAAASYGHLSIVKYLVEEKGIDANLKTVFKGTPLHVACEQGHFSVVKYLAGEKKVDLKVKDVNSRTVLHRAVLGKHLDIVKYLIEDADMLAQIDEVDYSKKSAAMEAASVGALPILKYLVDEKHASITLVTSKKYNMLHLATEEHHLPIVKYLVEEKGFDLEAKTAANKTAYDIAENRSWDSDYAEVWQYLKKLKEKH